MKQLISNLFYGLVAALLFAAPVMAQTYSDVKNDTSGNFVHRKGTITSASTVNWDNAPRTSSNHSLVLTSTAPVTATTIFALGDGTVTASRTDVVSGTLKISNSAPLDYQKFRVSPTGTLGAASLQVDSVSNR
ncbi:hypothetical protein EN866_19470 [Mesorhizobium sp. M2D.F.Ca.ET.223.01.1.1]|uniref:hypothetical protein n=1 Tax=unclassified Mesorhizobium TaxID=325217 RepID=UPI000FCC3F64|nr:MULTISPECIES: hypothetical protein [unclassified Mesorhizobium]TGP89341.1 hypothetical protein EN864_19480 [bacterium M00.F.Ca.ET.221.01.1.1]TGP94714.1 hypothetical protein EN865_15350 [bacterium M00.F.Ca.ET.222.01.1.1]RVD58872.1 hypothetical protein EN783_14645 [Mesorhizobium sp. M2D.F.Ca.ET.140.01.1.1]TGP27901.1 hypothetical protein EN875_033130 [Mesorhizobium sp. M2D.F.Ca.ET.232.01.1.1]TGP75882.1 hypothetical protein EN867_15350 [Mesorhizobium sp. M2D.F.Ca.ET.224.01.1.1]